MTTTENVIYENEKQGVKITERKAVFGSRGSSPRIYSMEQIRSARHASINRVPASRLLLLIPFVLIIPFCYSTELFNDLVWIPILLIVGGFFIIVGTAGRYAVTLKVDELDVEAFVSKDEGVAKQIVEAIEAARAKKGE